MIMNDNSNETTVITRISQNFSLDIPEIFRPKFSAGADVIMRLDTNGRVVIIPIEQIQQALRDTFAMWQDRDDLPADSVTEDNNQWTY